MVNKTICLLEIYLAYAKEIYFAKTALTIHDYTHVDFNGLRQIFLGKYSVIQIMIIESETAGNAKFEHNFFSQNDLYGVRYPRKKNCSKIAVNRGFFPKYRG